ncbi:superoxide dismutase [Horticoccus luteus]|uniref:Superoxide dismutase n=2 Tax=Horticoccus luteus TaxID=2862869 RepID=A0A8F9TZ26_9BACT|nr:superoxide dismutase [Horticoccus luteus]
MHVSSENRGLSRRDVLKTLGLGAALVALGRGRLRAGGAETGRGAMAGGLTQPFALPPLGFAYDALEPHIDATTMEIHYTKHHQGYVNNANRALEGHAAWQRKTAAEILRELAAAPPQIRTALRNNVGGHVNHTLFWQVITPGGAKSPKGSLRAGIERSFGSVDALQAAFNDAAMKRFGSGWAWLGAEKGKLIVRSTANQDSLLSESVVPLLGLDVWEHAYYIHYQNRRADYVKAFWNVVNWDTVQANFDRAQA